MPVRHRFVYEWPEGIKPITFDQWVQNLDQQEKQEFLEAKRRQIDHRTRAIQQHRMKIEQGSYVWATEQIAQENKPTDPVWYRYFQRYLTETQTKFRIEKEQC